MADTRKVIDVLIKARDETSAGVGSATSNMAMMSKSFGLASGAALAFGAAMVAGIGSLRKFSEEIHKTSMQLGISYEDMQKLSFAGKILDVDMRTVANALLEIQRRGPDAAIALATVGMTLDDIKNGSPVEIMAKMADGLKGIGDVSIRSDVAFKLFGRSYKEMLAVFAEGGDAIRELADKTPIIPANVISDFDRAGDAIDALKAKALSLIGALLDWRATDRQFMANVGAILGVGIVNNPAGSADPRMVGLPGGLKSSRTPDRVLTMADLPTITSNSVSGINDDLRDRITELVRALPRVGGQIGPAKLRASSGAIGTAFGARRELSDLGPVGMFQLSPEEERENKLLEDRVAIYEQMTSASDRFNERLLESQILAESLGASLVDDAFAWADAWGDGMGRVLTGQEKFADMSRRTFRLLAQSIIADINKIIARQLVAAVLTAIFDPTAGGRTAAIIAQVAGLPAVGGGGGGGGGGGDSGMSQYRGPTAVSSGDFGRSVTLNANVSTTFGSRSEVQAAATMLVRYAQGALA